MNEIFVDECTVEILRTKCREHESGKLFINFGLIFKIIFYLEFQVLFIENVFLSFKLKKGTV